ncbi:MAG TPA: hypothetical protein PKZ84_00025 [Anaerolineae bacterium]|nr:hypothetical protein [Anaerolineae bacterium]HQI87624.1 hypothetical protein [Anaerolineae bacterium]
MAKFKLLNLFWLLLFMTGCGQKTTPTPAAVSLRDVFPGDNVIPGWTRDGDLETYNNDTLYDMVDGQADAFFAYNFEQVAVQSYAGEDTVLRIEIWQLATPADAYGLFTRNRSGDPADIGNEGDTDRGRRLAFWQDRYYAQVRGRQTLEDATLRAFAEAVAAALPTGGETPALMTKLPPTGLVPRRAIFFRQEISIQDEIWLGGENILGLTTDTYGVLAHYTLNGAPALLLMVQYPDASAASAGLSALTTAQVDGLLVADANNALLAAVFGDADPTAAANLLTAALK